MPDLPKKIYAKVLLYGVLYDIYMVYYNAPCEAMGSDSHKLRVDTEMHTPPPPHYILPD